MAGNQYDPKEIAKWAMNGAEFRVIVLYSTGYKNPRFVIEQLHKDALGQSAWVGINSAGCCSNDFLDSTFLTLLQALEKGHYELIKKQ